MSQISCIVNNGCLFSPVNTPSIDFFLLIFTKFAIQRALDLAQMSGSGPFPLSWESP